MKDHFGGQLPPPAVFPLAVTWWRVALVVVLLLMVVIAATMATGWTIGISTFAGAVFGGQIAWPLGVRAAYIQRAEKRGEKRYAADLRSAKW